MSEETDREVRPFRPWEPPGQSRAKADEYRLAPEARGGFMIRTVDISDDGPGLDIAWREAANNFCGVLRGGPHASVVAERFVRAGWRSRSSSWEGYELETVWCRVEIDPIGSSDTLLNGVIDPDRLDHLAGLLTRFRWAFTLELYDDEGALVREIRS